jgi:hypothetical protein
MEDLTEVPKIVPVEEGVAYAKPHNDKSIVDPNFGSVVQQDTDLDFLMNHFFPVLAPGDTVTTIPMKLDLNYNDIVGTRTILDLIKMNPEVEQALTLHELYKVSEFQLHCEPAQKWLDANGIVSFGYTMDPNILRVADEASIARVGDYSHFKTTDSFAFSPAITDNYLFCKSEKTDDTLRFESPGAITTLGTDTPSVENLVFTLTANVEFARPSMVNQLVYNTQIFELQPTFFDLSGITHRTDNFADFFDVQVTLPQSIVANSTIKIAPVNLPNVQYDLDWTHGTDTWSETVNEACRAYNVVGLDPAVKSAIMSFPAPFVRSGLDAGATFVCSSILPDENLYYSISSNVIL